MGCNSSKQLPEKTGKDFNRPPVFIVPKLCANTLGAVFIKQMDTSRIEVTAVFVDPNGDKVSKSNKHYKKVHYQPVTAICSLTIGIRPARLGSDLDRVPLRKITTRNHSSIFMWEHPMHPGDAGYEITNIDEFTLREGRPVVHVNCSNMAWSHVDNNEDLEKTEYVDYPIFDGSEDEVRRWLRLQ